MGFSVLQPGPCEDDPSAPGQYIQTLPETGNNGLASVRWLGNGVGFDCGGGEFGKAAVVGGWSWRSAFGGR